MARKYLFVFSHDVQIRWYKVFAEGFKELGADHKTAIFVHGQADASLARSVGCYDEVYDLLDGFEFDPMARIEDVAVAERITSLEAACGASFFWEDIKTDRWTRAARDPSFQIQYLNHATAVITERFERLVPIAALGEYTMAIYRYAQRFFRSRGKPMFYPITTRYFGRLYFETHVSWSWERCTKLYHEFLQEGVPDDLMRAVLPYYEKIALKFSRPTYTSYQNQFQTGFVQIHELPIREVLRKAARALTLRDRGETLRNPRSALIEKGFGEKLRRIVRERWSFRVYERTIAKNLPRGVAYGVYFLHYQPEYTSEGLGKFYIDQRFLIDNIASSLPADMHLVVKEHPTMVGLRDADFYAKIAASPNVILLDHAFDSIELIKGSSIVFTIVGTPALEAMFMGKPAIMFGEYAFCSTNLISLCRDFWSLNAMIRDKLEKAAAPSEVERHAIALLAAKYAASRPGQIPIAVELVEQFLQDSENYALVKRSFQAEIESVAS